VRFLLGDEDHLSKPYNGAIYIFILTSSICLHFTYEWKHSLPSLFTHWRKHYFHLYSLHIRVETLTSISLHRALGKYYFHLCSLHAEEKRRQSVFTSDNGKTLTSTCLQKAGNTNVHLSSFTLQGNVAVHLSSIQTARNTEVHLSLL
jgi:hypothetical protein